MNFELSRRSFGLLTFGAIAALYSGPGKAQSIAYANPHLLAEPAELKEAVSSLSSSSSETGEPALVLIDVRTLEEYEAGHLPGAYHLAPNAVVAEHSPVDGTLKSVDEIAAMLGALGISANRRVIFYDDRGGFHAARMFWLMEYLGHRNVAVLNGGLSAWQAIDGPVTSERPAIEPAMFQPATSPRRHASADDVLAHRDLPDAVLIDVRPPKMYAEGHIPWAKNIPWAQNLDEDGRFKPAGELLGHFEGHGVAPESNVVMHCQVGLASSHSYLALRLLGFPRVRVYHRSWAEWGSDSALPKAVS